MPWNWQAAKAGEKWVAKGDYILSLLGFFPIFRWVSVSFRQGIHLPTTTCPHDTRRTFTSQSVSLPFAGRQPARRPTRAKGWWAKNEQLGSSWNERGGNGDSPPPNRPLQEEICNFGKSQNHVLHPRRLTAGTWEYTTPLEEENHLPSSIIFRFYVNLRGCKFHIQLWKGRVRYCNFMEFYGRFWWIFVWGTGKPI